MSPDTLARPNTEHAHQTAFCCWCMQQMHDERIRRVFAIPNGGERNVKVASRLKAEGVKPGVPDMFLPIPIYPWHGLWIEFKKPGHEKYKNGGMSDHQVDWLEYLQSQNYSYFLAYHYLQAANAVLSYLGIETPRSG